MSRKLPIQILITSLLLIFVFNNFGYWFCFKVEQTSIKEEMLNKTKQIIPNSQLIAVHFTSSEVKNIGWEEKNEFSYKGEMYDVVRSEKTATGVTYYCLNDAKEEALLANLSSHVNDNMGGKTNGKHSNDLLKLFSQNYYNNVQEFYFFDQASRSIRPATSMIYTSIKLDIQCPPPDRIS